MFKIREVPSFCKSIFASPEAQLSEPSSIARFVASWAIQRSYAGRVYRNQGDIERSFVPKQGPCLSLPETERIGISNDYKGPITGCMGLRLTTEIGTFRRLQQSRKTAVIGGTVLCSGERGRFLHHPIRRLRWWPREPRPHHAGQELDCSSLRGASDHPRRTPDLPGHSACELNSAGLRDRIARPANLFSPPGRDDPFLECHVSYPALAFRRNTRVTRMATWKAGRAGGDRPCGCRPAPGLRAFSRPTAPMRFAPPCGRRHDLRPTIHAA